MTERTAIELMEQFQAQVRAGLAALRADNARLSAQVADLREAGASAGSAQEAGDVEVLRRHLFRRGTSLLAGGAGLAAVSSIIGTRPAVADHLPGFGHNNLVGDPVTYTEGTGPMTLKGVNKGGGIAISGVGFTTGGTGGTGVLGEGATNGVVGRTDNPVGSGVYGENSTGGFGLAGRAWGSPTRNSVGVLGDGLDGTGVRAAGGRAPLHLVPGVAAGAPTGDHATGEIFVDSAGAIFQCVAGGPSSTWVRIGFNALIPARIADTRPGQGPPLNPLNVYRTGPLAPFETRTITVAGLIGPAGSVQRLVPLQASAAAFNVAVTDTGAAGFLTIYPADVARPNVSNLNWAPGQTISNAPTVRLGTGDDIGKIKIYNGSGGTTNVILDLAGFYS